MSDTPPSDPTFRDPAQLPSEVPDLPSGVVHIDDADRRPFVGVRFDRHACRPPRFRVLATTKPGFFLCFVCGEEVRADIAMNSFLSHFDALSARFESAVEAAEARLG